MCLTATRSSMHVRTNHLGRGFGATTLHRMITGSWIAQAIHVAAKLGIADLLKGDPQRYEALAKATNTHPRALYRVLRALASVGIFSEDHQ